MEAIIVKNLYKRLRALWVLWTSTAPDKKATLDLSIPWNIIRDESLSPGEMRCAPDVFESIAINRARVKSWGLK